jgi:hypothetical protein
MSFRVLSSHATSLLLTIIRHELENYGPCHHVHPFLCVSSYTHELNRPGTLTPDIGVDLGPWPDDAENSRISYHAFIHKRGHVPFDCPKFRIRERQLPETIATVTKIYELLLSEVPHRA